MLVDKLKKTLSKTKPYAERLVLDTTKGYFFGCVFSVFNPSKKPLIESMHESGKNFAKMSAVYSVTEMTLENMRTKKDYLNSFAAGTLAGAIGSKKGMLAGSTIFGMYSGLSSYAFEK